uniref:NADH-ubiquinone oxidoreductase chain 2 n=1 Tax=Discolomatidae sp. 3 ACP-2013 TaxID=1434486 RepID=A0A3G3FWX5_9CUCU|nr:NADH dehydrogenase subunit 2 [Discolomatidae sp. 3 ACP-2013]
MTKFNKILFLNFLMLGTFISISSISWMNMWIGLEMNLLSMIPLMNNHLNSYSSESSLKYFLTQVLASMILLFSIVMMMMMNEFLFIKFTPLMNIMMNSALFMKMGMAPFHFWFTEIIEGLNWINCLIMLTWQKITPMILIMYNCNMINFMIFILIISLMISSILSLNQSSMRKILAFSSMNHMSWMMSALIVNQFIWFMYFLIYSMMTINIIWIFYKFNIFYMYQIPLMNMNNLKFKLMYFFNFMSMGGLPPFLGFFPKWMILNTLINEKFFLLSFFLIFTSMIILYFYIRLMYSSLTISNLSNLKFSKYNNSISISILNHFNLFSTIWIILVYSMN